MSAAIRHVGIIPFVRNTIPGWSIEELTAKGAWFWDDGEGGVLGPWDWKIEVIGEGDIAYGKYIRNKAAFATMEWYRHLMNWRRSQPRYRMALGEDYQGTSHMDQLCRTLSPTLLSAVKELGSVEGSEVRVILTDRTTVEQRGQVKGCMEKYLLPKVKRPAADYLNQYLEMGTWTVVGEFRRVYRGPNLEYKGWQKSSITTPEALFGAFDGGHPSCPAEVPPADDRADLCGGLKFAADSPFWAKLAEFSRELETPACTPEESRDLIIGKILENFPSADRNELLKLI